MSVYRHATEACVEAREILNRKSGKGSVILSATEARKIRRALTSTATVCHVLAVVEAAVTTLGNPEVVTRAAENHPEKKT